MKTKSILFVGISVVIIAGFLGVILTQDNLNLNTYDAQELTIQQLKQFQETERVFLIDIRDSVSYMNGHIEGSANETNLEKTLPKRIKAFDKMIPHIAYDAKIVLIDNDGSNAKDMVSLLEENNLQAYYLKNGINGWNEELSTKITPTIINNAQLLEKIKNNEDIFLLDVREDVEVEQTRISTSVHIPLAQLFESNNIDEIPTDKPVIVICASGNRATVATYELVKLGIDFQILEDGIKGWDKFLQETNLDKI